MSKKLELSINLRGRGWKYLLAALILLLPFGSTDGNSAQAVTEVAQCLASAETE